MLIFKEFSFDAAHHLPNVPPGHKCKTLHGHTYSLRVYIKGQPDRETGWIMDFHDLKNAVLTVLEQIDHQYLNQVQGLANPTCENLIIWIWNRLNVLIPGLARLELRETPTSGAVYEGE